MSTKRMDPCDIILLHMDAIDEMCECVGCVSYCSLRLREDYSICSPPIPIPIKDHWNFAPSLLYGVSFYCISLAF